MMTCKDCEYFATVPAFDYKGTCHRYPPVGTVWERDGTAESIWVEAFNDEWCGEYKEKPK